MPRHLCDAPPLISEDDDQSRYPRLETKNKWSGSQAIKVRRNLSTPHPYLLQRLGAYPLPKYIDQCFDTATGQACHKVVARFAFSIDMDTEAARQHDFLRRCCIWVLLNTGQPLRPQPDHTPFANKVHAVNYCQ